MSKIFCRSQWLLISSSMLFAISVALSLFCSPAFAEKTKYVTIPIYYLTDRAKVGEKFGTHRRYPIKCMHEMFYGTAFITVANAQHLDTSDKTIEQLGWRGSNKKGGKTSQKDMISSDDYAAAKSEFFKRIKTALDKTQQNEFVVFVHGACDPFEDSAQDAADLAYYVKKPVVMYSWPAATKWRSYFVDGVNNEWSQAHFNMFCKDLCDFNEKNPIQVVFVSHSMGNRLVVRSLPFSYGKGLVREWEIVSADIDASTCRHYLMGITEDSSKIRVYVSNKDKMLPFAQMLAGGYYRTGEAANQVVVPKDWKEKNPGQIERIDFTSIDKGFTGHSIPFELLGNIINKDAPPDGYVLEPESLVHANGLVRIANRSEKIENTTGDLPNQFCKRVVKVKK
ncbi:MAG TPA: alpha/beta hydrolase [Oculatellaceae cyanobacterium]